MEDNILSIIVYADGVIGVRGIGNQYNEFYKWQRRLLTSRDICVDWPWHYFIIDGEDEFREFFERYRNKICREFEDYL